MIFILVTGASKEALVRVFYIYYLVQFRKDKDNIQALIDLYSKINIINLAYAKKLGLYVRQTDVKA